MNHEELKHIVCEIANQILKEDKERHSEKIRAFKERIVQDVCDMKTAEYTGYNVHFALNTKFCYTADFFVSLGKRFNTDTVLVGVKRCRLELDIRVSHEQAAGIKPDNDERN